MVNLVDNLNSLLLVKALQWSKSYGFWGLFQCNWPFKIKFIKKISMNQALLNAPVSVNSSIQQYAYDMA